MSQLVMVKDKKISHAPSESTRRPRWRNIFPLGSHMRETISDLQIIRSSLSRSKDRTGVAQGTPTKQ